MLEFAIGMGPALFKRQGKNTLYSLRLFPVGGFCSLDGEEGDESLAEEELPPPVPDGQSPFYAKPLWQKIVVLSAGALMNFLTGFIILIILSSRSEVIVTNQIDYFMDGFQYESSEMLLPGDEILAINGYNIYTNSDISTFLAHEAGAPYEITVRRSGEKLDVVVPMQKQLFDYETVDENGDPIVVQREMYGLVFKSEPATVMKNLETAWLNAIDYVRMVKVSLFDLFGGKAGVNDLAGPVGISGMIVETAQSSLPTMWALVAMIAVNLAVMNLLPLPAIDGGRIFFLLIGRLFVLIFKRPLNPKYENAIHVAGLVLFLGLMVYIAFNDIVRLVN